MRVLGRYPTVSRKSQPDKSNAKTGEKYDKLLEKATLFISLVNLTKH